MKFFLFDLQSDEDIILVNASINGKYKFRLALDTAATHTTIDSNKAPTFHFKIPL